MSDAFLQVVAVSPEVGVLAADLVPGRDVRIGRTKGYELAVLHGSVSRLHAVIIWSGGRPIIEDRHSQNGTFVNGRRVERAAIGAGDLLRCGDVELQVRDNAADDLYPTAIFDGTALAPQTMVLGPEVSAVDRVKLLLRVSELLTSPAELHDVLRRVLDMTAQVLDADRAAVLLVDAQTQRLEPAGQFSSVPLDEGEVAWSRTVVA